MNVWEWVALGFALAYWSTACATAGYLFAKEPFEEKGSAWWFSLAAAALGWPFVLTLWRSSRPVPPQPERGESLPTHENTAPWRMGPGAVMHEYNFTDKELREMPSWQFTALRSQQPITSVDRPASLALCGSIQIGERVWVKSLEIVFTRGEMFWFGACGCRYNFSGFPVVLCRTHRSDVDPHGEPDDNEEEVGR